MKAFLVICFTLVTLARMQDAKKYCKTTTMGEEYRGDMSTTTSGKTCQAWASQTPHKHSRTPSRNPNAGLDSNYCRNPDNTAGGPWCYTVDKNKRWGYCPVRLCSDYCKITAMGKDYRGAMSTTTSGKTCQAWASQTPHKHSRTPSRNPNAGLDSNYCRNPDNEAGGPWCYTVDKNKRWGYCPVPSCSAPIPPRPSTPAPPTLVPGTCGISPVPHSRVIGGKDATVGAWPWQAALRTSGGRFFCGGSLINSQWILTAAHCISTTSPSYYKITLGDHNRNVKEGTEKDLTVSKVVKHSNYSGSSANNDVALLKLSRPVLITKRISPVCLPAKNEVVAVGTKCYITGWGKIRHPGSSHHVLQQAVMPIRGKQECADRLAKSPYAGRLKITDKMVCAGNTGNSTTISGCHGDSGGPLVCQKSTGEFQLHGAVSWGSPKCQIQQLYTVFARITAMRDWIDRTVKPNKIC